MESWECDRCPTCKKMPHKSRKVAPFCGVTHRDMYIEQQHQADEGKLIAACARVWELADNEGRTCVVERIVTNKIRGRNRAKTKFETWWLLRCGDKALYPRAVKGVLVTCLGCIAAR